MTTVLENKENQAQEIAIQNDEFRRKACDGDLATRRLGRLMLTRGVVARGPSVVSDLLNLVRRYCDFDLDNDPYQEHDFGRIDFRGIRYFWKIDYYDLDYRYGSETPSDLTITRRVLTVMLAEEY